MAKVMKASEFVKRLKDVANNHKTLYVMGCFGSPLTASIKKRYINDEHYGYNNKAARIKHINAASADTFGFDCVNLIKGILWGWTGDKSKTYGGAKYNSNGVPDINANTMITKCAELSTNFDDIEVGEAVWTEGHIGVYIGDGLAVECTPAWKNKVQITACNCTKVGYNTRKWKKHGKLPYIEYDVKTESTKDPVKKPTSASVKVDSADKKDKTLAGAYKVKAMSGLHLRAGAGTKNVSLDILKNGAVVHNYGYYSLAPNGAKWLYVATSDDKIGFCSAAYLKKI